MEIVLMTGLMEVSPIGLIKGERRDTHMVTVGPKSWLWTSLVVILAGGFLALTIQWGELPDSLTGMVFVLVLTGGLIITKPRQPHAVLLDNTYKLPNTANMP